MKRLLLFLLLLPSLSFGTITDRYVTDAGAGSGDGSSEANAMSYATFIDYMSTGGSKTAAAGDRFNIIGTITSRTTTADTWVNGGSVTSPVIVRGRKTGDLDAYAGRTNGNGALVTTDMPTITYTTGRLSVTGSFILLELLNITSAASNPTIQFSTGTNCAIRACKIVNSSTNASAVGVQTTGGSLLAIHNSDISLTGASGASAAIVTGTGSPRIVACRINGGPAVGITHGGGSSVIAFNTIFTSTGNGIATSSINATPVIMYNTIVGGGADGINILTGTVNPIYIVGNNITDNTGDGIDMVSTSNAAFTANNRFRDDHDNTPTYPAGYNNSGDWITATNYSVVTSGNGTSDYVGGSGSSGDYRLIWSSPALGAGQPLYASTGALEPATPTPTPTATSTPSATSTPTATATPSATINCPVVCPTATYTPTSTPTATFTPTPSNTPTPSATVNCPAVCPTATATPSATYTPTVTPTPTSTVLASYLFSK